LEPELFAEIYYKFTIQKTYVCIRFQNFLKAGTGAESGISKKYRSGFGSGFIQLLEKFKRSFRDMVIKLSGQHLFTFLKLYEFYVECIQYMKL
jgi:hypothetical protein